MNESTMPRERLVYLLELVAREDTHLLAVRRRFLDDACSISVERLNALVADDIGIDRLESFGAKFARMQDSVVDKLIPSLRPPQESASPPRSTTWRGWNAWICCTRRMTGCKCGRCAIASFTSTSTARMTSRLPWSAPADLPSECTRITPQCGNTQ